MALDIVFRVRKLLANSKNNPSKEEAATAAALAQELIFKYQIGEADLDVESTEREVEPVENNVIHEEVKARRDVWKSSLANTIANAFGCKCYFDTTNGFKLHIVGTKSAVQTVSYTFSYLVLEISRLTEIAWAESAKHEHGKTWKNSFRLGVVSEVRKRLHEQTQKQNEILRQREEAAKSSGSTAIALYKADIERVADAYADIKKREGLRSAHTSSRYSPNAYQQGQAAGRDLSLGGSGKALGGNKSRIEA